MATPPEDLGPATQEAPEAEAPAAEGGRNVSPAQLAIVVGALVVLLALVWFFFLRGGGEEEPAVAPPPQAAPAPTEEPDVDGGGGRRGGPVETFEVFAPRDPFEPLVSAVVAGATPAPGETPPAGEDGTVTGAVPGAGEGEDIGNHRVRVVDVFREGDTDRAQIQVDSTVYTVDEGEQFAENFQLVSTSGRCATMLFGDDEFTLCEGEEILK